MENNDFIETHETGYKVKTSQTEDPIECKDKQAIFQKSKDPGYDVIITPKRMCVIGKPFS